MYNSQDKPSVVPQLWAHTNALKVKALPENKIDDPEQNNYSSCTAHNEVVVMTR